MTPTDRSSGGEPTNRFVAEVSEDGRVAVTFKPLPPLTDEELAEPITDEELDRLARHAGIRGEPHLSHSPDGRHPLCDWCQYPHIRACRLIAALHAERAENERLRAIIQNHAVILEYAATGGVERPTDEAIAEQAAMTEAYYADPDV